MKEITVNKNVQKMDESRLDYVGRLIIKRNIKILKKI